MARRSTQSENIAFSPVRASFYAAFLSEWLDGDHANS